MRKFFTILVFSLAPVMVWGAEAQDPQVVATKEAVAKSVVSAPNAKYCNIGADPLDARRKNYVREDEVVRAIEMDAPVTMRTAHGDVACILRAGEKIVVGPGGMWVLACGNVILKGIQAEVATQSSPSRGNGRWNGSMNALLALASRPMGTIYGVDGCGPKCRAQAAQVKFNFHFGASANVLWHHGLKGTEVNQFQAQSQQAQGGQGGTAVATGGKGGDTTVSTPPVPVPINPNPPIPGGPVNPNPPAQGGGGNGANPNSP